MLDISRTTEDYIIVLILAFLSMGGAWWLLKSFGQMLLFWAKWRLFKWIMMSVAASGGLAYVSGFLRSLFE